MKYSVGLESPFAFSAYWYLVGAGLILLAVLVRFAAGRILNRAGSSVPALWKKKAISRYRKKYLQRIGEVEAAFGKGEIDTREVCQRMSREVRSFVHAVTGWRTDTMVYLELTRLGRPELAELVRQYYEPEFAFYSTADAELAIEKGKELIIKWE